MEFHKYQGIETFDEGLDILGINLNDRQKQQFIDYYELLIEWNKVMNLTAITEFTEVIQKHFIDSLSIVKVLNLTNQKLLDLGTGAGFPGIPLKIAFPDLDIVLLDSLNKRLKFLNEVIIHLGLKQIHTLHGRAEDYGKDKNYREKFDICTSRAVAKMSTLSEYCLPYVRKDGFFISYKSGNVLEELTDSSEAIKLLGAEVSTVEEFTLPGTDMDRSIVVTHKIKETPKKYPRNAGKPSKEPL